MNSWINHREKGFTLIELIMVIVILGILAAVAIPKFVDLKSDAQTSRNLGVQGAIAGAITVKHSDLILNSNDYHIASLIAGIDQSAVTLSTTSDTCIKATFDNGDTKSYTYTEQTGIGGAATVTSVAC